MEPAVHPLRTWRLDRGYTLDAAAAGVGTYRQTWLDWEKERRMPDRTFMRRIFLFTKGEITPDVMHFPFGYPDLATPPLPLDDEAEAPLLEHAA